MSQPAAPAEPTAEEVARHLARAEARAAANATPMPGPVLRAFLPEPARAAGLELVPVVAYHWTILQAIDSPLLRQATAAARQRAREQLGAEAPAEEVSFTDDDAWELIYIFTRPVREARAALRAGREAFRETALRCTADVLPPDPALLQEVARAVIEHVVASLSTRVEYAPQREPGGEVFSGRPEAPQTAPAGGSITSAP